MNNLFYQNVRLLILTVLAIAVWGLSSFFSLPRIEDPEITPRFAVITTSFPGAAPERVETLITDKLEQSLFEVEEINNIESTSRLGFSSITVELNETINDVDPVWSRVRAKINDTIPLLPSGAATPKFEQSKPKANALIVALTWDLESAPNYAILSRWAQELDDQLRLIGGTEKVEQFGTPQEEITIEVNPKQLTNLGLTIQSLSQQILQSDAKVAAGQLRSNQSNLLLEINGELDSLDRLNRLSIQSGNSSNVVRLGDIAQIKKGILDPPRELALVNGRRAIAISAFVESEQRLDAWAAIANTTLKKFQQQLPKGVGLQILFDQSHYVEQRLNEVLMNLITGAVLVVGITLVMMGWKSSLIVGSALPLSVFMVFGSMKLLGVPLHQISVTGLIIALGLLIDNAIIVVDEVQIYLREGLTPKKAVATTVREIFSPLLASTFTSVLAFVPIATAPGGTGEFTGTIGVTVILALVSSLFLALTVIPALAGRLHYWKPTPVSGSWWQVGFSHHHLGQFYSWSLDRTFSRPLLSIALSLILPLWGFMSLANLEQQFFPPTDRGQFYLNFELPIQASLQQTQSQVTQARELMLRHPEIADVQWFIGKSAPPFYYNVIQNRENSPNYAQGLVQLQKNVKSGSLIRTLQQELDQAFPAAQIIVRQLEQGPPFDAPIELRVYGADLDRLRELGDQLRAELAKTPNVIHTRANLTETLPKLALNLDEEQLRLAGLDKTTVARQLDTNLEGIVGGSIFEGTEELPVRVRSLESERGNLGDIASSTLLSPGNSNQSGNRVVPLSAVGNVEIVPDVVTISRRNGKRVNTVQGFIPAGMLAAQVQNDFQDRLTASNFTLPSGYSWDFGGEEGERGDALSNLISTVGVLMIMMIASLVLTFSSFRLASIILVVAILSMGLGLGSLALFNYPFGFTAILGMIGLIGVAVNDSIVVLSSLNHDPKARQGDRYAARKVVIRSTRHVIATTLTTIIGFTPLLLDTSGFWPPLAITIVGGLGGATLIALYFVPSVYLLLQRSLVKDSKKSLEQ
ncbi:efflux RND transporter permease subunit [Nostoc parmelioides]|uniref:Efflux RND transporter permease subunit n=1 Tax=Nostoc parmelioides FACHB-3921 TaxID=2692909 RepID=A0ABR8BI65_9NOSO|nr:efflux RND transporter permease subunit [Nostoc parmelioides]MBD2253229.1 efflux RND transporter permease subunit [Nostoc parmelioides FACHB-3921]